MSILSAVRLRSNPGLGGGDRSFLNANHGITVPGALISLRGRPIIELIK